MSRASRQPWPSPAALAALLAPLALATPGPVAAAADAPPAAQPGATAAVYLFISVSPGHAVAPPVAELRLAGERALRDLAARLDLQPAPEAVAAAARQRWRVRSARSLTRPFLTDLHDSAGASHCLVGNLLVYPGRLVLTARAARTGDGVVEWAGAAEHGAPRGAGDWSGAVARVAGRLAPAAPRSAPGDRTVVLVLPATVAALDPMAGDVLTACLLEALLGARRFAIIDPGLLTGELQRLGAGAAALDSAACGALRRAFGPATLLVPELMAWDSSAGAAALPPPDDAGPAAGLREGDVVVALRSVDTATLTVSDRREAFRAAAPATGWFGARRARSPLDLYRGAAAELLAAARFD